MTRLFGAVKAAIGAAVLGAVVAVPTAAEAWWRGGVFVGAAPVFVGPPAYYYPPVVYGYPRVYPAPRAYWVPAYYDRRGFWVPGHWI